MRLSGGQRERLAGATLFATALLARLGALGRYVTPDELSWVFRSLRFRQALLAGNWAGTLQSGHPGVPTTWLGALGIQLRLWLQPASQADLAWAAHLVWLPPGAGRPYQHLYPFLEPGRLVSATVLSLALLWIYRLARQRLGQMPAFFATLLLALEPFVAGLSGLLHVDGLMSSFTLITLLLALPPGPETATGRAKRLFLAGITTAVAVLAKVPAALLAGFVPLLLFFRAARGWRADTPLPPLLRRLVACLLAYAAGGLLATAILLPASWAAPAQVLAAIRGTGSSTTANSTPQFFFGELRGRIGLIYYPVAAAFRLSPASFLGLLAALVFLGRQARQHRGRIPSFFPWSWAFGLPFLALLGLSARVFDRYMLPLTMLLLMLAGWGLAALWARPRWHRLAATLVVLQLVYAGIYWATPLLAYNWLLGGPVAAARVLPVGWGEGISAAARFAAKQPGAASRILFTRNVPAAAPFYPGPVTLLDELSAAELDETAWLAFSLADRQANPDAFDPARQPFPLLPEELPGPQPARFAARLAGLDQAWLYPGPPASQIRAARITSQAVAFRWGPGITLYAAGTLLQPERRMILLQLGWQAGPSPPSAEPLLRLEVRDATGHIWASSERPLVNGDGPPPAFWPPGESMTVRYRLEWPADLPPDQYTLAVALFDEEGKQQGVYDGQGRFAGISAPLATLDIPAIATQPPVDVPVPVPGQSELAGYAPWGQPIDSGNVLVLDLWWQQAASTPANGRLLWLLGPETLAWEMAAGRWRPGQTYHIRPAWRVPASLAPGTYPLRLLLAGQDGQPLWPEPVTLGSVAVVDPGRSFTLPQGLVPAHIAFWPVAQLQHLAVEVSGEQLRLRLVWQADQPDGQGYTVFVHLRDASGQIIDQRDRPPAIPSDTWVPEQVVEDSFTFPLPPGLDSIAIGLYDAGSGQRLPVFAADGTPQPDDQWLVPWPGE